MANLHVHAAGPTGDHSRSLKFFLGLRGRSVAVTCMCMRWALWRLLSRRICLARLEMAHWSLLLAITSLKEHGLLGTGELVSTMNS